MAYSLHSILHYTQSGMNSESSFLLTIDWAIVVVRELSMITELVGEAEEEPDHLLKKLRYRYHIMINTQ